MAGRLFQFESRTAWLGQIRIRRQTAACEAAPGTSPARRVPRVLVSTLAPGSGGVNAMTSFVVRNLTALGLEPVIAHYAPYSVVPDLSVPSFKLLQRAAKSRRSSPRQP